jgi:2-polyprenyl-6-hydroxyphenyl methylase/3-demethylubiquinone-9 3-methyltransferase
VATSHKAAEQLSFEETLARLPSNEMHARSVLDRLGRIAPVGPGSTILDIGAAQGRFAVAAAKLGFCVVGVEPWAEALPLAARLAAHEGVTITMVRGVAESLPFADSTFDAVHAMSVIEHVKDAPGTFAEACRVLKPGGAFWFYAASSLCPAQDEIKGFPLFGWYPDRLKRHIMDWAVRKKPHLVGGTEAPAINWFTPWKARRMLRAAGFGTVYDRWNLPRPGGENAVKRLLFGGVRLCFLTKCMADVLVPGCAYAAIK